MSDEREQPATGTPGSAGERAASDDETAPGAGAAEPAAETTEAVGVDPAAGAGGMAPTPGTGGGETEVPASDPGTASSGTRDPEEIRAQIEETREELGETVAALAEKADVKTQAKKRVEEARGQAKAKAQEFSSKAQQAAPESASSAASQATQMARENPAPLAGAGALALAFLLGWLIGRR